MRNLVIFILLSFCFTGIKAQFSGTALTEYQYGKLPKEKDDRFNSVYSKLNLNYGLNNFKFGAGVQIYQSPYNDRNYVQLAQFKGSYQAKSLKVNLGNYSEVLGRGILLRNYEIPGAVIEDLSFRSKQYFYTDMLGASANYTTGNFSTKVLWGYALDNLLPPTQDFDSRRKDEVFGLEFGYTVKNQKVEFSGLRINNNLEDSYYGMGSISGLLVPQLTYYFGYADYLGGNGKTKDEQEAHALYGNLTWSQNNIGISIEYKSYDNFLIGSGINEPPALIKEHSYKLLNRSTHVLQPLNESGIQFEGFYQPGLFSLITLNYTYARNDFAKEFNYNEWFLEFSGLLFKVSDLKLFADYAQDPFKGEEDRVTLGIYLDAPTSEKWGFITEIEGQKFDRYGENVNNYLLGLTIRNKSKLYVGLNAEWSNDSFITDKDKWWIGGNMRYKASSKHTFQLFGGERRGGPACSAGVCYEVLDFRGIEVRWTARL